MIERKQRTGWRMTKRRDVRRCVRRFPVIGRVCNEGVAYLLGGHM